MWTRRWISCSLLQAFCFQASKPAGGPSEDILFELMQLTESNACRRVLRKPLKGLLRVSRAPLGGSWGPLGRLLGASCAPLGASWSTGGAAGGLRRTSGGAAGGPGAAWRISPSVQTSFWLSRTTPQSARTMGEVYLYDTFACFTVLCDFRLRPWSWVF